MDERARIVLTVTPEGAVSAETRNILGDKCLDYIALLEDLLEARTVESSYTADRHRTAVVAEQQDRNVDRT
jgi:hypothetical protein